ncbi:MAG TPA: hypothetical protein GXX62_04780 [Alcaligenaceae bacterium]|nr:hypothetical protein [Alcaligenaceae bacterium]
MNKVILQELNELKDNGKISCADYDFTIDYFSKNKINFQINKITAKHLIDEIILIFKRVKYE